jgi:hypothetical protein
MTDPRRDLINLTAVLPQVNHRRQVHTRPVTSIIKRSRSQNDISTLYPSMYNQQKQPMAQLSNQTEGSRKAGDRDARPPLDQGGDDQRRSGSAKASQPRKAVPIEPTSGDQSIQNISTHNSRMSTYTPQNMSNVFYPGQAAQGTHANTDQSPTDQALNISKAEEPGALGNNEKQFIHASQSLQQQIQSQTDNNSQKQINRIPLSNPISTI